MRLLHIAAVAAAWFLSVALVAWLVAASAIAATPATGRSGAAQPPATESSVSPGYAGTGKSEANPSPELMRALMTWASPRLGLPVPAVLPRIVRRSHCELQAIVFESADCSDESTGVLALYTGNVLWLNEAWRGDDLRDVSILLHELVHHMQHHAGVAHVPCQAQAIERPAYEAQFAFLEAAGVDPYETVGINELMLVFVTHCLGRH